MFTKPFVFDWEKLVNYTDLTNAVWGTGSDEAVAACRETVTLDSSFLVPSNGTKVSPFIAAATQFRDIREYSKEEHGRPFFPNAVLTNIVEVNNRYVYQFETP